MFILGLIQLLKFTDINYSQELLTFFATKEGFLKQLFSFLKFNEGNEKEIEAIP